MKTIAFFNNKGGVGKTFLVYHLGWNLARQDKRVLLVDLDPQANLTAMCLDEERLVELWVDQDHARKSIRGALEPIIQGVGDFEAAHLEALSTRLSLLPGDIRLSDFEQKLSDAWPRCNDRDPAAFRIVSSFHRIIREAAARDNAELVLIDVGPNVGAVNRTALIAADFVITPLGADLFSVQGMKNLGPVLARWRTEWSERISRSPVRDLDLPAGSIRPIGYVVMQPNLYGGQVTKAYDRWMALIPGVYSESVLRGPASGATVATDPNCLAVLRHYRSLMPMAQTARKPIFHLTAADGAIGAHSEMVRAVGQEFDALRTRILERVK